MVYSLQRQTLALMANKGETIMGHAIVIDIFNDVKEPTKMIETNTTNYGEIKGYGCTILPCLSPEEIYSMYAAGYTEMNDNKKKIIYLDNQNNKKSSLRPSARGCWKTR